jgi:hypothetical protein
MALTRKYPAEQTPSGIYPFYQATIASARRTVGQLSFKDLSDDPVGKPIVLRAYPACDNLQGKRVGIFLTEHRMEDNCGIEHVSFFYFGVKSNQEASSLISEFTESGPMSRNAPP